MVDPHSEREKPSDGTGATVGEPPSDNFDPVERSASARVGLCRRQTGYLPARTEQSRDLASNRKPVGHATDSGL